MARPAVKRGGFGPAVSEKRLTRAFAEAGEALGNSGVGAGQPGPGPDDGADAPGDGYGPAIAAVIDSLGSSTSAAVRMGHDLIVKVPAGAGSDSDSPTLVKMTLTDSQVANLDSHPAWLADPSNLLERLEES